MVFIRAQAAFQKNNKHSEYQPIMSDSALTLAVYGLGTLLSLPSANIGAYYASTAVELSVGKKFNSH